jgi:ornithine carbamoyltransferase
MKRDFLSLADYSKQEIMGLIKQAYNLKSQKSIGKQQELLHGKSMAMIFDKPSTRTRVSFEMAMFEVGGHCVTLQKEECGIGVRESGSDVARTLSRFCDAIMIRTFEHEIVEDLAKYSSVPVINGLTDLLHPCQALADGLTIYENVDDMKGVNLTYIGDGNNVAHSLMHLADKTGLNLTICTPKGYAPEKQIIKSVKTKIKLTNNPDEAVKGAEFIYTDTWASMGQEDEASERRKKFKKYQVNQELVAKAKKNVKILHCLPAHRGEEITDEVIDSENSLVFDQAENRLHAQKAVLLFLLG